jgi:MFS transporter, DHA1 family, inner membrane transport protein
VVEEDRRAETAGYGRLTTDWRAVWAIFAAGLAAGAYMSKVPPALPAMRADLELGLIESGFIHTMMYAIGAAAGAFCGAFADRFGQKRAALLGVASMLVGGILGALTGQFGLILVSRFLEGAGFVLIAVSAASLIVTAAVPRDRPAAFAIWSCYMPAGGTLILLLAPLALVTLGWRGLWVGLTVYTAATLVMVAMWVPAPAFGGGIGSLRLLRESLLRPGILLLCLAFMCYVGQWVSVMTWLPTFVVGERGASSAAASLLTAAFVAFNIPGVLLGGYLLTRRVPRSTVIAAAAAAMGLTAIGLLSSGAPDALRFACVLAFSLLGGMIPSAVFAGTPVHSKSPGHIGTTNGMVMQTSHLAQFVVPIVVAWVASRWGGWSATLGVMLLLSTIGVAAGLGIARYERKLSP